MGPQVQDFLSSPMTQPARKDPGEGPHTRAAPTSRRARAAEVARRIGAATGPEVQHIYMFSRQRGSERDGRPQQAAPALNHILQGVIGSLRPDRFSGRDEDWATFASQWGQYALLLDQTSPGLPEMAWVMVLRSCMDEASAEFIDGLIQRDPRLTFDECWRQLEQTFNRDMTDRFRRMWEELRMDREADPTLPEFRSHTMKWATYLGRVPGVSEEEATRRFLKSIPRRWHEEALMECERRMQDRFWVRIPRGGPFSAADLVAWYSEVFGNHPRIAETAHDFILECSDRMEQEDLIACHGLELERGTLQVFPHKKFMTYAEVSLWLEAKLRVRDEVRQETQSEGKQHKSKDYHKSQSYELAGVESKPSEAQTSGRVLEKGKGAGGGGQRRGRSPEDRRPGGRNEGQKGGNRWGTPRSNSNSSVDRPGSSGGRGT